MDTRIARAARVSCGLVLVSVPVAAQAPPGGMSALDSLLGIPIESAALLVHF